MLLALGTCRFDITHRALVAGVVDWSADALGTSRRLVDEGADIIEIDVAPGDPDADGQVASVVGLIRAISADGIPVAVRTESVALRAVASAAGAIDLDANVDLVVSTIRSEREEATAHQASGIVGGARIVRTRDVRRARRVVAVIERLLEASGSSPAPVP